MKKIKLAHGVWLFLLTSMALWLTGCPNYDIHYDYKIYSLVETYCFGNHGILLTGDLAARCCRYVVVDGRYSTDANLGVRSNMSVQIHQLLGTPKTDFGTDSTSRAKCAFALGDVLSDISVDAAQTNARLLELKNILTGLSSGTGTRVSLVGDAASTPHIYSGTVDPAKPSTLNSSGNSTSDSAGDSSAATGGGIMNTPSQGGNNGNNTQLKTSPSGPSSNADLAKSLLSTMNQVSDSSGSNNKNMGSGSGSLSSGGGSGGLSGSGGSLGAGNGEGNSGRSGSKGTGKDALASGNAEGSGAGEKGSGSGGSGAYGSGSGFGDSSNGGPQLDASQAQWGTGEGAHGKDGSGSGSDSDSGADSSAFVLGSDGKPLQDPEDYFTRINLDENLFKKVEVIYRQKAPKFIR